MTRRSLPRALDRTDRPRDQGARGVAAALALLCVLGACRPAGPEAAASRIPDNLQTRFFPPPGWTWSRLPVEGAPALRYGVATPPRAVHGHVVILPGYAEPAEAWFETAGELVEAGYAVWIMDLAGQGGSGRWLEESEKGHLVSMDANIAGLAQLIGQVVHPASGAPVVVMGSDLGGQAALRAASHCLPEVDAVILSAPSLGEWPLSTPRPMQSQALARGASLLGLDERYAPGQGDWRAGLRDDARVGSRTAAAYAWSRANPELRTGGATWGWINAYDQSLRIARSPATLKRLALPVLMLDDGGAAARRVCDRLPDCRYVRIDGGEAPHLADDRTREVWRRAVLRFIGQASEGYAVAAAPVRTATGP